LDPGETDSDTLHGVAHERYIAGVWIGREWLAMSGVSVINHDDQSEVVRRRVHRVPITQHNGCGGLECSQVLCISPGRRLIPREENQRLLGDKFA
jgi:hypothetical protein